MTRLISAQVILSHWHLTLSHRACLRRATTRLTEGKVFQNSSSACLRMNGAYNVRELFVESVLLQLFLLTYQEALQVKWFFLNLARKNWKLMYFLSFLSALEQAWKKKKIECLEILHQTKLCSSVSKQYTVATFKAQDHNRQQPPWIWKNALLWLCIPTHRRNIVRNFT